MKSVVLVFLGGGLGSALRFLLGKALNPLLLNFPLGTFSANLLGSLLIGIVLGFQLKPGDPNHYLVLLFAAGFCGGFTTFSAFAFEQLELLKQGAYLHFLLYVVASVTLGLLAVALGSYSVRFFS